MSIAELKHKHYESPFSNTKRPIYKTYDLQYEQKCIKEYTNSIQNMVRLNAFNNRKVKTRLSLEHPQKEIIKLPGVNYIKKLGKIRKAEKNAIKLPKIEEFSTVLKATKLFSPKSDNGSTNEIALETNPHKFFP
jgi:hypothetical protein